MGVLLLNGTYEALRVISVRRAIMLVMAEKADVLEIGDDEYHSASASVPVPEVIRLRYVVKVPFRARIPLSNQAVLRRDGHKCAYCPRKGTTVDHVVPKAKGGKHEWTNVVACCRPCNARKADKTLAELRKRDGAERWTLAHKLHAPTGTMWLLVGVRDAKPAWETYLGAVPA